MKPINLEKLQPLFTGTAPVGDVIVTQAAREAAAKWIQRLLTPWGGQVSPGAEEAAELCRSGERDDDALVQMLATFERDTIARLAATPVQNRGEQRWSYAPEPDTVAAQERFIASLDDFQRGYEACREDAARALTDAEPKRRRWVNREQVITAIRHMEARNG